MPNRLVREGILTSERVNRLSPGAELFYRRLMSAVDDFGRFDAHPTVLLTRCYPFQLDRVTSDQVAQWLQECAEGEDPLVLVYRVGRKLCLQINEFGQRTRTPSKYPDPPKSTESAARSERGHDAVKPPSPSGQPAAHATTPTPSSATPSDVVSEQTTTTPEVSLPKIAAGQQLFERLIGAFLAAGVKLSEPQFIEAATEFVSLPDEEHLPATLFFEDLARKSEARWMGLPASRLRKREWAARGPGRLLPSPRSPTKSDESLRRAGERFRAKDAGV